MRVPPWGNPLLFPSPTCYNQVRHPVILTDWILYNALEDAKVLHFQVTNGQYPRGGTNRPSVQKL